MPRLLRTGSDFVRRDRAYRQKKKEVEDKLIDIVERHHVPILNPRDTPDAATLHRQLLGR